MISDPLFWIALLSLVGSLYILANAILLFSWRRNRLLPASGSTNPSAELPEIAVILAARDEEDAIGTTLASLSSHQNPTPRVIAVDDRSADMTPEIMAEHAGRFPNITHVRIEKLPEGWLGKCHALQQGSEHLGDEEWVLFTDADVEFAPGVLAEAVAEAERAGVDHFVLFPHLRFEGRLEGGILTLFTLLLGTGFSFHRVESDDPEAFVGIGAFNMIRSSLYRSFDRHTQLRMEVADDMKLGYLAKKHGGRSTARYGGDRLSVRWRQGALDTLRGIVRSGFPGMNFHWGRLLWATAGVLVVFVLPFLLLPLTWAGGVDWSLPFLLSLVSALSTLLAMGIAVQGERSGFTSVLLTPVAGLLFAGAIFISGFVITKDGGVWWRETFYPIEELRRGTVR